MRKAVSQKVVIVVVVVVAIVTGFIFWRLASPKKKHYLPGLGEVGRDGTPVRERDPQERRGPGTSRRGPGGGG